jgi:hypothetical protein
MFLLKISHSCLLGNGVAQIQIAEHFYSLAKSSNKLLVSYPAERIDFDTTNIPAAVVKALEEAITCHANQCFVAAAIMVRKTLEELCREREARGSNLKERIRQLGSKVVLPKELLDGLDDLRLLGNDAAHIESQEYDKVRSGRSRGWNRACEGGIKSGLSIFSVTRSPSRTKKDRPDSSCIECALTTP